MEKAHARIAEIKCVLSRGHFPREGGGTSLVRKQPTLT